MNPLTFQPMAQLLRVIRSRYHWQQKRLQQFADREGLSLLQVTVLLEDKRRAPSLNEEIDRVVESQYQSINQPA